MSKQKSLILLKMLMGILNFAFFGSYHLIYNRYGEGNLYCTKLFKSYYIFTNESGKNSHSDVCGIIYFSGNY